MKQRLPLSRLLRVEVFRSASLPVWTGLCLVLSAAVIAKVHFGIPFRHMMGDPAVVTGWPFYVGFVSNVGALLWAATAAIFFFTFFVQRTGRRNAECERFLLASGIFVGLLGIDDLFLLHEHVFPAYLAVSQLLVVAGYGVLASLYLVRFAHVLARTAYPVFLAAVGMLAVSAALDQLKDLFSLSFFGAEFCEDALKLMGIGTWLSYAGHTCAMLLAGEQARGPAYAEVAPWWKTASSWLPWGSVRNAAK